MRGHGKPRQGDPAKRERIKYRNPRGDKKGGRKSIRRYRNTKPWIFDKPMERVDILTYKEAIL